MWLWVESLRKPVDVNMIPIIDKNVKTDRILQEDEIRAKFEIPDNEECADLYAHYVTCKHILVEEGNRKDIEKAIRQLKNTSQKILQKKEPLHYISIVSDGITKKFSKIVKVTDNVLYYKHNGKPKPVEIQLQNSIFPVHHYRKSEVKRDRDRANRTSSIM
jgi:hypothetical protein